MSWHHRTAQHCLNQLGHVGIKVTVTDAGKLKLKAPDGIDLRQMLPVIKKYKPGIIWQLKQDQRPPHDAPDPAREAELMGQLPPGLRDTVGRIKAVMADLGDGAELIGICPNRETTVDVERATGTEPEPDPDPAKGHDHE